MLKNSKVPRIIFASLLTLMFGFIFGPTVYGHFMRQTGESGWGYGYGYGYGYGDGWDGGDYGSGINYSQTHDRYEVGAESIAGLVQSGVMAPNGRDITSTTQVKFYGNVAIYVGDAEIFIDRGTVMSAGGPGDFSRLQAESEVDTEDLLGTAYTVRGSMGFGLPDLGLSVSPPVTMRLPVDEGQERRSFSRRAAVKSCLPASPITSSGPRPAATFRPFASRYRPTAD